MTQADRLRKIAREMVVECEPDSRERMVAGWRAEDIKKAADILDALLKPEDDPEPGMYFLTPRGLVYFS